MYLSVYFKSNKLGLASFIPNSYQIEISSLWTTFQDYSLIIDYILFQQPSLIIFPSNISPLFKQGFISQQTCEIPSKQFKIASAKRIIVDLVYSGNQFLAKTDFNIKDNASISAAGGLLAYLVSSGTSFNRIQRLSQFSISALSCDIQVLESLQIFKQDTHPSKIKNPGRSKEGFSLYGVLENCVTGQGKKLLKQWILRPLSSPELINSRLDTIEFYLNNTVILYDILTVLKNFKDLTSILNRFTQFTIKLQDWQNLIVSMEILFTVIKIFSDSDIQERLAKALLKTDIQQFLSLYSNLKSCLDFSSKGYLSILKGVCDQLDYLRSKHSELNEFLLELAKHQKEEFRNIGWEVPNLSVYFLRNQGYIIQISFKDRIDGGLNQQDLQYLLSKGFDFQFQQDNSYFFKSLRTRSLDSRFGDLSSSIRDAQQLIFRNLETDVLEHKDKLLQASWLVAELDAIFSLARTAQLYKLNRPKILDTPTIEIVNGKHFLCQICDQNFIPNDCDLNQIRRVAVITGPNCSGKTVYLKMVGLTVYMAHIGMFVSAQSASIGIFDKIFTKIVTERVDSSCFSQEISSVSVALNNCTEKSLLLIDEFGKGTNAVDGMSLFAALVKSFQQNSPIVLLTTHYQELITHNFLRESRLVKFYTMEMRYTEIPVFLYKLINERPQGSFGINCAKLGGVPRDLVTRAEQVRKCFREKSEIRPICKTARINKAKQIFTAISQYSKQTSPEMFFDKINDILNS